MDGPVHFAKLLLQAAAIIGGAFVFLMCDTPAKAVIAFLFGVFAAVYFAIRLANKAK